MPRIHLVLLASIVIVDCWRFHLLSRNSEKKMPGTGQLDWCAYWKARGVDRDECKQPHIELPETTTLRASTATKYWDCRNEFYQTTCRRHDGCISGKLCMDVASNVCCEPPKNACPTTVQMGIKCFKQQPTNWCHNEFDCAEGSLCCDTGCDYNICI